MVREWIEDFWKDLHYGARMLLKCQVCGRQGGLSPVGACPQGGLWMQCVFCCQYRVYDPPQIVQIQPGQIVARVKKSGMGYHFGVRIGDGVFHNEPGPGAHYTDFQSFANNGPVWPASPPPNNWLEYQQIVENARALEGKPYDLLQYNCEDTASQVRYGNAKSPTRDNWIGFTLIAAIVWGLSRELGTPEDY